MEEKTCAMCANYYQHYTLTEHGLVSVCCGHCRVSVQRKTKPDRKACEDFVPGTQNKRELFVTKKYLSKKLLQYILDMELLPDMSQQCR